MNRCLLLMLGLLTCATGSGCCHYCHKDRGCVDWQQGCPTDPGCNAPPMRGARLQHHRPRMREDDVVVEDEFTACDECGRRHRRRKDNCGVCDDCSRGSLRDRRAVGRRGRRGRQCDGCGGVCTGACGGSPCFESCSGSCGGTCSGGCFGGGGYVDAQGYAVEGDMLPMSPGGSPMMGEGMSAPSGGCSGCSGGGASGMYPGGTSSMGAPIYQGTVMNGQIISGGMPMGASTGWVPASMPSTTSEPVPVGGSSGVVYSQPGSTAPAPGGFPTPAR